MKTYKIAVIPGDGIGPEVIGETIKVLEKSGEKFGFSFEWEKYPYGAGHYLATGEVIPELPDPSTPKISKAKMMAAVEQPTLV